MVHFTGPIRNRDRANRGAGGAREWYSEQPSLNDPDYIKTMLDFTNESDYNSTDFLLTQSNGGTASINVSNLNGLLVMTTAATGTDSVEVQSVTDSFGAIAGDVHPERPSEPGNGKRLWCEIALKASDVATTDILVGLEAITATPFAPADFIGFQMSNGSAAITASTVASSTANLVPTGRSMVANTQTKLGFYFDGDLVNFYVNRQYVGNSAMNIPTALLAMTLYIKDHNSMAKTLTVDYINVVAER